MKTSLSLWLVTVLAFRVAGAELHICTIDLQRVMSDYYKTEEATKQLKLRDVSYLKELEPLRLEGTKLEREARDLALSVQDNALSNAVRDEKKKLFEQKQIDLGDLRVRYDDLQSRRQSELQRISLQTRKQIVDDVMKVTRRIGETEGFNLILNANQTDPVAAEVVFSKGVADITERVLASLNSDRPKPATANPGH